MESGSSSQVNKSCSTALSWIKPVSKNAGWILLAAVVSTVALLIITCTVYPQLFSHFSPLQIGVYGALTAGVIFGVFSLARLFECVLCSVKKKEAPVALKQNQEGVIKTCPHLLKKIEKNMAEILESSHAFEVKVLDKHGEWGAPYWASRFHFKVTDGKKYALVCYAPGKKNADKTVFFKNEATMNQYAESHHKIVGTLETIRWKGKAGVAIITLSSKRTQKTSV